MTEIAQNALGLIEAIKDLKSQVTSLTKERDELKEGIPIEKADKKKKYHWHNGREWVVLFWNQGWKFKAVKVLPIQMNVIDDDLDRLYLIPTQISETQEGS